jgi:hypothetical protein
MGLSYVLILTDPVQTASGKPTVPSDPILRVELKRCGLGYDGTTYNPGCKHPQAAFSFWICPECVAHTAKLHRQLLEERGIPFIPICTTYTLYRVLRTIYYLLRRIKHVQSVVRFVLISDRYNSAPYQQTVRDPSAGP